MFKELNTGIKKANFQSLGDIRNIEYLTFGIQGLTTFGNFRVLVFDHSIIRITISKNEEFEDFSYAVDAQPLKTDFKIDTDDDHLTITTELIKLVIKLKPVRFKFYNLENIILNEDDPIFGTAWIGNEVTAYKRLQDNERFIGLGEKTGDLDRRGKGYLNWNSDNFAYGMNSDPIYGSYPFYMGIHHHTAYGIFLDNSHKSHFNFGASNNRFSSVMVEGGDMDYYFIHRPKVSDIIKDYTFLTGRTPIPPKWSLGYQQCRYSYFPESTVLEVARTFREKNIPADVMVLDIHYMDEYKIFTWDAERFPDPSKLIEKLHELNFHVVLMCDPGIKIDEHYDVYQRGLNEDVYLKYPDGTYYSGEVWPGWCHFPDFTRPETRAWWSKEIEAYASLGIDGFWNDMNEISTWGQMLPEHIEFDYEGHGGFTKKAKNIFGLQMARSTYEGGVKHLNGSRPFNLTRSGFSGIQRYAAVWTGDNYASDEHMMLGVRLINSLGLTGVSFTGYDVGGFVGDASPRLFARWISIGSFSPFFRGHSMINSRSAEPWSFGELVEEISRNYITLRYKLMPYIYSLFYESSETGMPVNRSLAIDYTHDSLIYDNQFQNQYLFGPFMLVCPVKSEENFCKVYLPAGNWFEFFSGEKFEGNKAHIVEAPLEKIPVFIKEGSIIPMQSFDGDEKPHEDGMLMVHFYVGESNSSFTYYEDDGSSFQYQSGLYYRRAFKFQGAKQALTIFEKSGNYKSRFETIKLMFHGFEDIQSIQVGEKKLTLKTECIQQLKPITSFDPLESKIKFSGEVIKTLEFPFMDEEIVIRW